MAECPTCGAQLEESGAVCTECGGSNDESTASFGPVGGADEVTPAAAPSGEGPCLVVRKGAQLGERFFLDRARLTVGRDPESGIFLNDMTVSRSHAVLTIAGSDVTVTDSGSLNGTYVNGVCIDSAVLSNGDIVQIGTFQMAFYAGEDVSR